MNVFANVVNVGRNLADTHKLFSSRFMNASSNLCITEVKGATTLTL